MFSRKGAFIMHLFLEGPVQTGKSTLIRECIQPYLHKAGGFSCQRLWREGIPCGYRITSPRELQLDAPYSPELSGIFLYHFGNESRKDPSVFETLGISMLEQTEGCSLILLDEIGGSELLIPSFRTRLYEILAGSIPCIGVLKLADKAKFMGKTAGYPGTVVEFNEQLRKDLHEKFGASVLSYNPACRDALKKEILQFTERIF